MVLLDREIDMKAFDLVTDEAIERRLTGWTESEWEGCRENWLEYRAALGPEATRTFREFAYRQAAMNELYSALKSTEAA
jgi:hypothetical protein